MLQLEKKYLEVFYLTLKGTEGILSLAESRTRDGFMKTLGDVLEIFYADRKKIYETYATRKEDGIIDLTDNKYYFAPEKLDELNGELTTLLNEKVELSAPESLKPIIEKTTYNPKVGEVEMIDHVISLL